MNHHDRYEHDVTCLDLSEDIWIKIIQYTCSNSLSKQQPKQNNPTCLCILDMFRTLPLVSKQFHKICQDYVKVVPLEVPTGMIGNPKNLPIIAWMCREKVKIGRFDANSYYDINPMWLKIIVLLLNSCNTSEMTSFIMKCDFSLTGAKELGTMADVEKAGITLLHALTNLAQLSHEYDHQALLANTLLQQAPNLRSLSLIVQDSGWYRLYLENFSETIQELELYAYAGEFYSYHYTEQHGISSLMEQMKSLKYLTLSGEFRGSMTIISASLETIDIRDMAKHSDFVVDCCICPSLRFFSCAWDAEHANCIGLEPLAPLDELELHFDADGKSEVQVQYRPFYGMDVPPTCVVSLVHKRFLF